MPNVLVHLIRHAESADNVKRLWAGWKDSPLSNHGMNVCYSPSRWFSTKRIRYVYASDLQRAQSTAEAIVSAQASAPSSYASSHTPACSFFTSKDLREQHFGSFEGQPYSAKVPRGGFRAQGGENKEDMMVRAERFVKELIVPLLDEFELEAASGQPTSKSIAIVSHGIFLRHLVKAFMNLDGGTSGQGGAAASNAGTTSGYALSNTGYGVLSLSLGTQEPEVIDADALVEPAVPNTSASSSRAEHAQGSGRVSVAVLEWNSRDHLSSVKRQKGGIGSMTHDPGQKDIRTFFSNAAK